MRPWHIVVFVIVVLIVFGSARLPDIAKSLGQSAKILRKEMRELQDDDAPAGGTTPAAGTSSTPQQPGPATPSAQQPGPAAPADGPQLANDSGTDPAGPPDGSARPAQ